MDEVIRTPARAEVLTDDQAMAFALFEARKGLGHVSPNPAVGCVILDSKNGFLASGYHHRYGGPHAEVDAVTGLSPREMQGAKIYVTLEPCAHEGKTPSCAKMIAKLPFQEVVYGLVDPNPLVAGEGLRILNQAGISTREYSGAFKTDCFEVCEHFLINQTQKRPFISLKVASSLDGQLALKTGESKWITGEESRLFAHFLRATHDAILVGQKTLEIDDPSLDVRHPHFPNKKNKVIVLLSTQAKKLNPQAKIFSSHAIEDVFLLRKNADEGSGYVRVHLQSSGALVDTDEKFNSNLTTHDHAQGPAPFSSILVEGGAQVISSFINGRRADRLYVFQAPVLLGGKSGKSWAEDVIIGEMKSRIELKNLRHMKLGNDLMLTGRI